MRCCCPQRVNVGHCLQTALACFEGKKRLLEHAKLLRNAFVVTAQEPLPDELVTAVQVCLPLMTPTSRGMTGHR